MFVRRTLPCSDDLAGIFYSPVEPGLIDFRSNKLSLAQSPVSQHYLPFAEAATVEDGMTLLSTSSIMRSNTFGLFMTFSTTLKSSLFDENVIALSLFISTVSD